MLMLRRLISFTAVFALSSAASFAQDVLAAKSGLVHYIEGEVSVDGKALSDRAGAFAAVPKDGEISTDLGRAELLLTPGVLLRVAEHSSVRMLNPSLADTRLLLQSGDVMIESDTPMKDNNVTMVFKDYAVTLKKPGLYGFSSDPAQLKVFSGEAEVLANGQTVTVREGRLLPFGAALAQEKFNSKEGDSLYRWSKRRSEYLSIANLSAAKQAQNSNLSSSGWFYNSFYGLYTYLPFRGTFYSPFGYTYFSPRSYYDYYYNNPSYNPGYSGGTGHSGVPSSVGTASRSSVAASSGMPSMRGPSTSAGGRSGAAASAGMGGAISRGGGQAGGRGR